ncbi:MAG: Holliday junction resolvase RuvX [Terriglobales bacterium]
MERRIGRIAALDLGQRRIGIALSDPLGISAQGLPTLQRQDMGTDLAALAAVAHAHQVALWLVGLPLHMSGEEGRQAQAARRFGAALARHSRLPVEFWDERLTTVEASRVLDAAGSSLDQRRRAIDRLSAVILLQSFLEARREPL